MKNSRVQREIERTVIKKGIKQLLIMTISNSNNGYLKQRGRDWLVGELTKYSQDIVWWFQTNFTSNVVCEIMIG